MAAGFDLGFLQNVQGVQLPDPVKVESQALTFADLARRSRMGKIEEEELGRRVAADRAYESELPELIGKDFSPEAVAAAAARNPNAAAKVLTQSTLQQKHKMDLAKDQVGMRNTQSETRKRDLGIVSGLAQYLQSKPNANPQDFQTLAGHMRRMGFDPSQFGDPTADPKGWLGMAASASIDASKQIDITQAAARDAEAAANNLRTDERTRRGQDIGAETAREGHAAQRRGQDIAAGTAGARLAWDKENANRPTIQTGANGELFAVDPRAATGRPVLGPDNKPIAKPKTAPEAYSKQTAGIENLNTAITEYQDALKKWGTLDILSPDARSEMGTKYNNMMLQAKEAYNLGVLNGPDYSILQDVVADPASLRGAVTSNTALSKQASELGRIMKQNSQNLSRVYRQPEVSGAAPAAADAAPPTPRNGEVRDGYMFNGGDPADQKNWKKVKD